MKQSYSEALSGWQHSVESKEEHLQKPKKSESERRERRYITHFPKHQVVYTVC